MIGFVNHLTGYFICNFLYISVILTVD